MKISSHIIMFLVPFYLLSGCGSDSVDAPTSNTDSSLVAKRLVKTISSTEYTESSLSSDDSLSQAINTYEYDDEGFLIKSSLDYPNIGIEYSQFDIFSYENGLVTSITNGDDTDIFTYENGKITSADLSNSSSGQQFYLYDAQGRLSSVTATTNGIFDYYYGDCHSVTSMEQPEVTFSISYDGNGKLSKVMGSLDDYLQTYEYSPDGKTIKIEKNYSCYDKPDVIQISYLASGLIDTIQSEDKESTRFTSYIYDAQSRLIAYTGEETTMATNAVETYSVKIQRDNENLISSVEFNFNDTKEGTTNYTYEYESQSCRKASYINPADQLEFETLFNGASAEDFNHFSNPCEPFF